MIVWRYTGLCAGVYEKCVCMCGFVNVVMTWVCVVDIQVCEGEFLVVVSMMTGEGSLSRRIPERGGM